MRWTLQFWFLLSLHPLRQTVFVFALATQPPGPGADDSELCRAQKRLPTGTSLAVSSTLGRTEQTHAFSAAASGYLLERTGFLWHHR